VLLAGIIMPSATTLTGRHPQSVPPPIPAQRPKTTPPTAKSSNPDATIPLNLEDLMLEMDVDSGCVASDEDATGEHDRTHPIA